MGIAVNLHRSIAQHINKAQSSRSLLLLPPPPLLWPPLTPTTAPDTAMVDTDLAPTAATATARGLLMLMLRLSPLLRLSQRLRPTMVATDMAAMVDTAVVFTDTARGPLMLRPTTAMAALAATAMAAMVDTDTARGPLMPRPTMVDTDTAGGPLMPTTAAATAMAVTVTAVATPGASK